MENRNFFDTAASIVYVATLFLGPLFFLTPSAFPLAETKYMVVIAGVTIAVILWCLGRFKSGAITMPHNPLVWALGVLVVIYFLAALFANPTWVGMIGDGFAIDSLMTFVVLAATLLLGPLVLTADRWIFSAYLAFFVGALLLAIFIGIQLLAGYDWVRFTDSSAATVLGTWQDVGIFYGLTAVISMITLALIDLRVWLKGILYLLLFISLGLIFTSGVVGLWWLLGIVALVFLLYVAVPFGESGAITLPRWYLLPVICVILISMVGIFRGGDVIDGDQIPGIQHQTQELSVESTISISKDVLETNPVLGVGPNRYEIAYNQHTPESVFSTPWWNTSFEAGSSYLLSVPITLGAVGILGWIVFLGLFLAVGVRALVITRRKEPLLRYLTVSSYLGALFLFGTYALFVPNIILLFLGFAFAGLFVSVLYQRGIIKRYNLSFVSQPKEGFISIIILAAICIGAAGAVYTYTNTFIAAVSHHRANNIRAVNAQSLSDARKKTQTAIEAYQHDSYYRTAANITLAQLNRDLTQNQSNAQTVQETLATALEYARNATAADSADYTNWITLGNIYAALVPHGVAGAYEEAQEAYKAAAGRSPEDPTVLLARARLAMNAENFNQAKKFARQAQNIKPDYTAAAFLLTRAQVQAGDVQAAMKSARSAIEIAPNDPTLFFQLGLLEYISQNYNRATQAFERAIELEPAYANAQYYLGLSYARQDRNQAAITVFEKVLQANPNNTRVSQIIQNLQDGQPPLAGIDGDGVLSRNLPVNNKDE
jgi:tetratricopeptide (TPR) repeat protein